MRCVEIIIDSSIQQSVEFTGIVGITSIDWGDGTIESVSDAIGNQTFDHDYISNSALYTILISGNTNIINAEAFYGMEDCIVEITFSNEIGYLGDNILPSSSINIFFEGNIPPTITSQTFNNIGSSKIHVPIDAYENYMNAEYYPTNKILPYVYNQHNNDITTLNGSLAETAENISDFLKERNIVGRPKYGLTSLSYTMNDIKNNNITFFTIGGKYIKSGQNTSIFGILIENGEINIDNDNVIILKHNNEYINHKYHIGENNGIIYAGTGRGKIDCILKTYNNDSSQKNEAKYEIYDCIDYCIATKNANDFTTNFSSQVQSCDTITTTDEGTLIETENTYSGNTKAWLLPNIGTSYQYYDMVYEIFIADFSNYKLVIRGHKTDGSNQWLSFYSQGHNKIIIGQDGYKHYINGKLFQSNSTKYTASRCYLETTKSSGNGKILFRNFRAYKA